MIWSDMESLVKKGLHEVFGKLIQRRNTWVKRVYSHIFKLQKALSVTKLGTLRVVAEKKYVGNKSERQKEQRK